MTYVGGDRLGLSAGTSVLIGAGSNFIIPGSGPVVAAASGVLSNLFGGNRDKVREAREQWFEQGTAQGSVISGRIMIGGTQNTASNENKYYREGIDRLMSNPQTRPTMEAAQRAGAYWDASDNDRSDKMRALVENELIDNGRVSPTIPTSTGTVSVSGGGSRAQVLDPVVISEKRNWWPWILGGVGVVSAVGITAVARPSRRNRRR